MTNDQCGLQLQVIAAPFDESAVMVLAQYLADQALGPMPAVVGVATAVSAIEWRKKRSSEIARYADEITLKMEESQ